MSQRRCGRSGASGQSWLLPKLGAVAMAIVYWLPARAEAQPNGGAEKFNRVCAACHTIGGGRRVGPDLRGVHERHSDEWLLRFIAAPQRMIDSGDQAAVALRRQYDIVMPDQPFSQAELREIIEYVKSGGAGQGAEPAQRPATAADIHRGRELFQGQQRFVNGGPACNSCHHVRNDAVIGGGVLAKELTTVFSRMGSPGLHAILGRPPFPVMEEAFREHPLTDDEVFALVSFLQDADRHAAFQHPRDYGFKLVYSGLLGFVGLMGLYWLYGRRRKKRIVNQEIYDRQLASQ